MRIDDIRFFYGSKIKQSERIFMKTHLVLKVSGKMRHLTPQDWEDFLTSDEKIWTVDGYFNPQNDRVRARRKEDVEAVERDKFPGKRMVWLGATARGITPLVHFEGNVNGQTYQDKVLRKVILEDVLVNTSIFWPSDNLF